ncbi:hypothetical protein NDU88_005202 [Pleurodeles waltl]|uniref:Secreted protein n=1 Tax=Pleurodeles waltl TaxID=8319 RepID=A0AAV7L465_PLEWA|nr:hypothetical protein NDU88_005202 [Pleurodeles waltl]
MCLSLQGFFPLLSLILVLPPLAGALLTSYFFKKGPCAGNPRNLLGRRRCTSSLPGLFLVPLLLKHAAAVAAKFKMVPQFLKSASRVPCAQWDQLCGPLLGRVSPAPPATSRRGSGGRARPARARSGTQPQLLPPRATRESQPRLARAPRGARGTSFSGFRGTIRELMEVRGKKKEKYRVGLLFLG